MYRIYFINFGYFADGSFSTLDDARAQARKSGFEASFWMGDEFVGSWSILSGFRRA